MSMLDKLLLKGKSDNGDGGCGGDGYGRVGERSGERGFTIIEVMLAVGVGVLVMVLVLVAANQLQTSQRNSQRSSEANRISTKLIETMANRNGQLPANHTEFNTILAGVDRGIYDAATVTNAKPTATAADGAIWYFFKGIKGSGSTDGEMFATTDLPPLPKDKHIHIIASAECKNNDVPSILSAAGGDYASGDLKPNTRSVAVVYLLEDEGNAFCIDNA